MLTPAPLRPVTTARPCSEPSKRSSPVLSLLTLVSGTVFYDARPQWLHFDSGTYHGTLAYAWGELNSAKS